MAQPRLQDETATSTRRADSLSPLSFAMQPFSLAASLFCYLTASAMDFRYTRLIAAAAIFAARFLRRGARKDGLP